MQVKKQWGTHSLLFKLPAMTIQLKGLSRAQRELLAADYRRFTTPPPQHADESCIECRVYQLPQALLASHEQLTWNGQYAPLQTRTPHGVELTGINFLAQIQQESPHIPLTLGVAEEKELAQSIVIENFLRVTTAYRAIQQGGLLLHSAGLVYEDEKSEKQAFIFPGRSNAGKTTLTRKAYQHGARVLSDDINVLLPHEEGYHAYAVPFTGEFGRTLEHKGGQESYPVAGIILLEQGEGIRTTKVKNAEAVAALLAGCPFVNTVAEESTLLFDAVLNLVSRLPVIRLVSGRDGKIDEIMAAVRKELNLAAQPNHAQCITTA
ncbi:MAG: hypothetical protein D3909_08250 [Candidatus Electrothrix sp. ATG1]|nr:hypothetical protein [Candidatus Electrothrix sp. ATG1]